MKQLIIMVMACYGLTASAQLRESEDFLYLFNDSVVYANRVTLRPNFYGNLQVRVDSRQVPVSQVKFLNNREGFFANTGKMSVIGASSFSERVVEGNINVFQAIPDDLFTRGRWNRNEYTKQALTLRMYYNKGLNDLKKVRYNNLAEDMADSQKSIDLLKGYRRRLNTSKIFYITAGASLIAGVLSTWTSGNYHQRAFGAPFEKPTSFAPNYILMGLGTGLAIGGYVMQKSANGYLGDAIDTYNR